MDAILEVVELLKLARADEAGYVMALADAQAEVEKQNAIAVAEAYQSGQIDGKNAEARKVQEIQLLSGSAAVHTAKATARYAETKLVAARIEREYQADRYRAMLALMQPHAVELSA